MPVNQVRCKRHQSDFAHHEVNGCAPRGWNEYRPQKEVKGRIVGTTGKIRFGGVTIHAYRPVLLVRVDTSNRNKRRLFRAFCHQNRVEAKIPISPVPVCDRWVDAKTGKELKEPGPESAPAELDKKWEWTTVYEVTGGTELEELLLQDFVVAWFYPLSVGSPRFNSSEYWRPRY